MSIQTEITRLQGLRHTLRTKLTALGLVGSTADLQACVTAVQGLADNGAVSKTLDATTDNQSYTVPGGYHNGSGKVQIALEEKTVTANGTVTPTNGKVLSKVIVNVQPALQSKTVTPTKAQQTVSPDTGKYGLSSVVVEAIPDNYADIAGVTAAAGDVLANKIFVDSAGAEKAGTMPNNGAVAASIDGLTTMSYTIPAGYHNGSGKVTLTDDIENALAAI